MKAFSLFLAVAMPFACSASPLVSSEIDQESALVSLEATLPEDMLENISQRRQQRDRAVAYPLVYHPIHEIFVRDQPGVEITGYDDLGNATDYVNLAAAAHIRLADNSVWQVVSSDQFKVAKWRSGDLIRLKSNNTGWSRNSLFPNVMYNLNTGDEVQVKAKIFGRLNIEHRTMDTIKYLSTADQTVTMTHGGKWRISGDDARKMAETWAQGDMLMVGVNEAWFSGSCPNILMNLSRKNACRAVWLP